MGRRSGKRSRTVKARQDEVVEELTAAQEVARKKDILKNKPDHELFFLDSVGSSRKRRKLKKEAKAEREPSKNEQKLVEKYMGKMIMAQGAGSKSRSAVPRQAAYDPWAKESTGKGQEEEDGNFIPPPRKLGMGRKRPKPCIPDTKTDVCLPGQSYNPTVEDHDDVLAQAVAVELRRQDAAKEEAQPISKGMSAATLALITGDNDGKDSSDELDQEGGGGGNGEDDDDAPAAATGSRRKHVGKLTRAQRNKQKRVKEAALQLAKKRAKKDLLKSVGRVDMVLKDVVRTEAAQDERRQSVTALREKKKREGSSFMGKMLAGRLSNKEVMEGPSVPINLGEELHGSLRLMQSQGSILLDKVSKLRDSKIHPQSKSLRKKTKKGAFTKKVKYSDRYKDD